MSMVTRGLCDAAVNRPSTLLVANWSAAAITLPEMMIITQYSASAGFLWFMSVHRDNVNVTHLNKEAETMDQELE